MAEVSRHLQDHEQGTPGRSTRLQDRDNKGTPITSRQHTSYCDPPSSPHYSTQQVSYQSPATATSWDKRYFTPSTPTQTKRYQQDNQVILSPESLKSNVAMISSRRKPLSSPYQHSPVSLFSGWSTNNQSVGAEQQVSRHNRTFSEDLLELGRKQNASVKRHESTFVSVQHHPKRKKVDYEDGKAICVNSANFDREKDCYYSVTKTETIVHKRRWPVPSLPSHAQSKHMLMSSGDTPRNVASLKPAISTIPAFTVTKVTRRERGSVPTRGTSILPETILSKQHEMKSLDGKNLLPTAIPETKDKMFRNHNMPRPTPLRNDVRVKSSKRQVKRKSTLDGVIWTPIVFSLLLFYGAKWMFFG